MSITIHNLGNYNFSVKLSGERLKQLSKLSHYTPGDFAYTLQQIIIRGFSELTGELPENRS